MWKGVEQDKFLTGFPYFQQQLWAWAQPHNWAWLGCWSGGWGCWNAWKNAVLPSIMLLESLLLCNRKVTSAFTGHFIYVVCLTRNCWALGYNMCKFFCFLWLPQSKLLAQHLKLILRRERTSVFLEFMFLQCFDYTKITLRPNHLSLGFFHIGKEQYGSLQRIWSWCVNPVTPSLRRVRLQNCCLTVVAATLRLGAGGCHSAGQLGLFGLQALGTSPEAVGAELCVCSLAWDGAMGAGVGQPHWAGLV